MWAEVRNTGEHIEVVPISQSIRPGMILHGYKDIRTEKVYDKYDLNFDIPQEPDYWEKLKHQYAGMAMQGMLSNALGFDEVRKQAAESGIDNLITLIAGAAADYATALVNKLKSESNG